MDISETYIKMCEKAWSDLKEYEPLFSRRMRMLYVVDDKVGHWRLVVNISNYDRAFPLWEQDQLQEMVKRRRLADSLDDFARFCGFYRGRKLAVHIFKSMETIWLAFVMKEKYSKIWDGENWVK